MRSRQHVQNGRNAARGLAGALLCAALAAAHAEGAAGPYSGRSFESVHAGTFNGERLEYEATFADVLVTDDEGKETASIFATSYVRTDVEDAGERPVIFLWNGGPTAASQPLHMAGFGPRRLIIPEVGEPVGPPWAVRHNPATLLDVADLVFVDPVETGYSRMLPAADRAWLFSVDGDAESFAAFIRAWLAASGREASPAYVLGTSYGSIRAVLVASRLAGSSTPLAGAILFSQGVNLVETTQRQNNIVGYASNMSQQAAIAWYHGRTAHQDKSVSEVIDMAERFAMDDYLVALAQGRRLPDDARKALAMRLEGLTGVAAARWLESDLRMTKPAFRRELLQDEGRVLGANDARYTAAADAEEGPVNPTAGVSAVHREHMAAFLGVDLPPDEYRPFAPAAFAEWGWGGTSTLDGSPAPPGALRTVFADFDYPGALLPAFEAREDFRIFIATGIYDTLTTVGPARLLAAHPAYPEARVALEEYPGGHAFYADDDAFVRLADDLRAFLRGHEARFSGSATPSGSPGTATPRRAR